jgi:UDPglucose--hexose-1-phosphate uridylyltransferase
VSFLAHDSLTGDSIILAPGRHHRPNPYGDADVDICPFCPGHEGLTPPEVLRAGGDPWRVRAFANKYPVAGETAPDDDGEGLEGSHEVIVESPLHDAEFQSLTDDHLLLVTGVWLSRYRALAEKGRTVVLFKNSGSRAGASLSHIHSQLVALPFVPPRLAHEIEAFGPRGSVCPLCQPTPDDVVRHGAHFRWEAAESARLPYGQRIVPHRHAQDFTSMTESEEIELGSMLRDAAAACANLRADAAYNWGFHNFPPESSAHWYVEIIPRVAGLAGFELTTGCYINSVDAETAARELRERRRV